LGGIRGKLSPFPLTESEKEKSSQPIDKKSISGVAHGMAGFFSKDDKEGIKKRSENRGNVSGNVFGMHLKIVFKQKVDANKGKDVSEQISSFKFFPHKKNRHKTSEEGIGGIDDHGVGDGGILNSKFISPKVSEEKKSRQEEEENIF